MFPSTTLRLFDRVLIIRKISQKKYDLSLIPFSPLREITMKGPTKEGTVSGKLGYVFMRGDEKESLENQIAKHIRTPMHFDTYINLEDVKNDFDYIIVATGDETVANRLEYGTQRQLFIQGLLLYWEISKWVVQKCGSTGL